MSAPASPPALVAARPRRTRPPMATWDRLKIFFPLLLVYAFLVWSSVVEQGGVPLHVALPRAFVVHNWLLMVLAIEAARQLHFAISERSAGYHMFWQDEVFGWFHARSGRMNDWNRYRLGRALKILFWIAILDLLLAKALGIHPATALVQAPILFFNALPFILQIVLYMTIAVGQFVAIFWFLSRGGMDVYFPEDIKTRFSDVWGQDHVVEKVKENLVFLEDPEAIERKGGYMPGGILLWGPPGTGKTLMAEAVAGETGKPFVFVEPGAFIQMFVGVGILKVKSLFRKLRKLAVRYGGVVVFFDEADALGNRGSAVTGTTGWMSERKHPWEGHAGCNGLAYMSPASASAVLQAGMEPADVHRPRGLVEKIIVGGGMGGGGMGTLQALLTEMSGLKKPRGFFNRTVRKAFGMRPKPPPNYRILIMMASNMPQALDPALLRPGRIDRKFKVGYPSKEGRIRTYAGYLSKVRHNLAFGEIDKLATMTPYATGASIKDLVNEALINSIREGRRWIVWEDIIKARLLKELGPAEDVEYIERERHSVAIHEACHAVAAYRVRKHLTIDIATIEKGQDYLGMVASIPIEEQFTRWRSEYESDLMVTLAAHTGEQMFFEGDSSSGVSSDLQNATTVAMLMEGYWGMGDTMGSQAAHKQLPFGAQAINDVSRNMLETELGRRVEERLRDIVARTRQLLERHRGEILAVAHALETHKTLTGDDVVAVIEGTRGPLIDGRPYHNPAFARMLEDYHTRAVEAHKVHGRVEAPLPAAAVALQGAREGVAMDAHSASDDA